MNYIKVNNIESMKPYDKLYTFEDDSFDSLKYSFSSKNVKSKKPDGRSELQVTAQQQIECKADSGYVVLSFRNKHTDRIPYHNWRPSCSY